MKAVVLEIRDGYAAVMVKGGSIERIRDNGYKPGQEIVMPRKNIVYSGAFRIVAAAAALVFVFVGGGLTYARNFKETGYVTVDVNPSLEYAMNAKCRVIKVTALNEDAEEIAKSLKDTVKGGDLESVLESTKEELYKAGYLGEEKDNVMLVSVVSDDSAVREDLKLAAETVAAQEDIAVYVVESTMSERREAKEQGVSTGRYEVSKKAAVESGNAEVQPQSSSVKDLVESGNLTQVTAEEAAAAKAVIQEGEPVTEAVTPTVAEMTATPTEGKKPGKKPTPTTSANDTTSSDAVTPTEGDAEAGATPTPVGVPEPGKPTEAAGPTATPTSKPVATATPTAKPTATPTPKPATGPTATPTSKPTATPTPKPMTGPTATPTSKPTATPTPKPATGPTSTPTPTPLPTVTPTPTVPPTETPTPTEVPVSTPTPTEAASGASDNKVLQVQE